MCEMSKIIFISILILTLLVSCNNSQKSETEISTNNNNIVTNENEEENTESDEANTVGIYVYDYPFGYLNNGEIGGFDYDIMNEIAKVSDLKIKFIPMKFEELIPALDSEQIDIIIAGMTVTEERKKL